MESYQQRVTDEKKALDIRLESLVAWLSSPQCSRSVEAGERERLERYVGAMKGYSDVLGESIGV